MHRTVLMATVIRMVSSGLDIRGFAQANSPQRARNIVLVHGGARYRQIIWPCCLIRESGGVDRASGVENQMGQVNEGKFKREKR
jgi:hypothetical protein